MISAFGIDHGADISKGAGHLEAVAASSARVRRAMTHGAAGDWQRELPFHHDAVRAAHQAGHSVKEIADAGVHGGQTSQRHIRDILQPPKPINRYRRSASRARTDNAVHYRSYS